jgi:hypothetical protein
MLETAAFDPIWTEFNRNREGRCTVPCVKDYAAVFKGKANGIKGEWENYDGPQLEPGNMTAPNFTHFPTPSQASTEKADGQKKLNRREETVHGATPPGPEPTDSFAPTSDEEAELRNAGVIAEYELEQDKYPPNNRTLENFFRGAWTYHIHNQWFKHPEPSSWLSVIEHAHDGFFAGQRSNMYGEFWSGPQLMPYNFWPEYV